MADIFDSIPTISVILFAIGIIGIMVYTSITRRSAEQSNVDELKK